MPDPPGDEPADPGPASGPPGGTGAGDEGLATHRKLYETHLRALDPEERAARALTAEEPELSAFCYDQAPPVLRALLRNPRFGPSQARLVAAHHHDGSGLEALAARPALAADAAVRHGLLRNPQLPASLLRRLCAGRRLLEHHQLAVSRDLPEQTRRGARDLLRARFATAGADERVEVILKTEGRCLAFLGGLPVDGKTAALLCGRTYTSTLLVQNVARWAAAPPSLVGHLLRQDLVRRSPALRTLLLRHPNAPAR